jgi:hypothetical protein
MSTATKYKSIWAKAEKAGNAAAKACTPTPIIVGEAKAIFGPGANDIDYSKPVYQVPQGICGFASIRFKGNTGFGRWAKKAGLAQPSYQGGLRSSVRAGNQSYEIKVAYAQAFVGVLQEEGITDAYYESRLD